MPRFVILRHETPSGHDRGPHYDLMFERGDMLLTWSLPELPIPGKTIPASALADHRLDYLELEGPLSGDRGSVRRVEEGKYDVLEESEKLLRLVLSGKMLRGILELRRPAITDSAWVASFSS